MKLSSRLGGGSDVCACVDGYVQAKGFNQGPSQGEVRIFPGIAPEYIYILTT
jgi:hypothetical protein